MLLKKYEHKYIEQQIKKIDFENDSLTFMFKLFSRFDIKEIVISKYKIENITKEKFIQDGVNFQELDENYITISNFNYYSYHDLGHFHWKDLLVDISGEERNYDSI